MRGRPPKPTIVKLREGNLGKRRLDLDAEPRPDAGIPPCPTWLDRVARAEWRRVAPLLEKAGLLTLVDQAALAAYCDAYSTWRQATLALRELGLTVTTATGMVHQRPEVAIRARALATIRAFCAEFGMTPSARARMSVGGGDGGDDALDRLLSS